LGEASSCRNVVAHLLDAFLCKLGARTAYRRVHDGASVRNMEGTSEVAKLVSYQSCDGCLVVCPSDLESELVQKDILKDEYTVKRYALPEPLHTRSSYRVNSATRNPPRYLHL
jgi:hypothetical protein